MAAVVLDNAGSGSDDGVANPFSSWGISGNVAAGAVIILAQGGDSDSSFNATPSGSGWSLIAEMNGGGSGYVYMYDGSGTGANPSISWGQTHDRIGWAWASYSNVEFYDLEIFESGADTPVNPPSHASALVVGDPLDRWVAASGFRDGVGAGAGGWTTDAARQHLSRNAIIVSKDGTDSDTEDPGNQSSSDPTTQASITVAMHSAKIITPATVDAPIIIPSSFTIQEGAGVTATEVDLVAGLPAVTVIEKQLIVVGSVDAITDIPLPDIGLRPEPVNIVAAIPAPSIGGGTAITVAAVSCVAAVPSVTVLERQTVTATTVAAPAEVPAATAIERITISATNVDLVAAVPLPPSVTGGQGTAPATVSAPVTIVTPAAGGPTVTSKWSLASELRSEYELSI